jgi:hypothetical protein
MLSRLRRRAEATVFEGGTTFWQQARPGVVSGGEVLSRTRAAARFSMHMEMNSRYSQQMMSRTSPAVGAGPGGAPAYSCKSQSGEDADKGKELEG